MTIASIRFVPARPLWPAWVGVTTATECSKPRFHRRPSTGRPSVGSSCWLLRHTLTAWRRDERLPDVAVPARAAFRAVVVSRKPLRDGSRLRLVREDQGADSPYVGAIQLRQCRPVCPDPAVPAVR